jgi:hypothetical protein
VWTRAQFRAWLRPAPKEPPPPPYLNRRGLRAFLPLGVLLGVYIVGGLLLVGGLGLLHTLAQNAESPQRVDQLLAVEGRVMDTVGPWVPGAPVFVLSYLAALAWMFWQLFRVRAETRRFHAAGGRICGWCGYDSGRVPQTRRSVCAECGKETVL